MELTRRNSNHKTIYDRFGFIFNILETNERDIKINCNKLCDRYPTDFEKTSMVSEFIHFKFYLESKAKLDKDI